MWRSPRALPLEVSSHHFVESAVVRLKERPQSPETFFVETGMRPSFGLAEAVGATAAFALFEAWKTLGSVEVEVVFGHQASQAQEVLHHAHLAGWVSDELFAADYVDLRLRKVAQPAGHVPGVETDAYARPGLVDVAGLVVARFASIAADDVVPITAVALCNNVFFIGDGAALSSCRTVTVVPFCRKMDTPCICERVRVGTDVSVCLFPILECPTFSTRGILYAIFVFESLIYFKTFTVGSGKACVPLVVVAIFVVASAVAPEILAHASRITIQVAVGYVSFVVTLVTFIAQRY